MIDTSFLRHLDRFNLIINKRITSNYIGERKSSALGRGIIFKDHSPYVSGDDFRAIDWKVYARLDKLFVKRYEEERNLSVHIVVDFSASMDFGTGKLKKSDFASMIGVGFAYLAMRNNEKFVLSTFSDTFDLFRPRRGKRQLAAIVDYLNSRKPKGHSNFEESLVKYKKRMITSRSLVVIISDFLYDTEEIKHVLYRLAGHDIKLIQVLDKLERDLYIEGDFKLKDLETDERIRTFIGPYLKKKYNKAMADHNAEIKKVVEEVGADFYTVGTDEQIFDVFHRILMERSE